MRVEGSGRRVQGVGVSSNGWHQVGGMFLSVAMHWHWMACNLRLEVVRERLIELRSVCRQLDQMHAANEIEYGRIRDWIS